MHVFGVATCAPFSQATCGKGMSRTWGVCLLLCWLLHASTQRGRTSSLCGWQCLGVRVQASAWPQIHVVQICVVHLSSSDGVAESFRVDRCALSLRVRLTFHGLSAMTLSTSGNIVGA